jgi:hypothetical protein
MAADRLTLDRLRDLRERAEALTRPDRWSDPDYEDNLGVLAALDELIERRAEAPTPPSLPFG